MERRVHVLPDHVANQIAAGEVVERPASVVKELVENSLDAGATRVTVLVEDGGKRSLRIIDNGCGMTGEDAMCALLRHATSKVQSADDLKSIGSLGFRGEALPSIRSVSKFSLRTRTRETPEGVQIIGDGAEDPQLEPCGTPPGTEITIRDLFYNVPARRKFLRTTGTEMSRISNLIDRFALGWPGVHITLKHNGRRVSEYPADRDLQARILAVLGRKVCHRLYGVELEMGHHRVHGYVSEPTLHRPNGRSIYTYINGRFVRDRVLQHALTQAYGNLLDRGRYPVAVLYLSVPPEAVDVNVHPAKAEVRFVESGAVHGLIERALKLTLNDAPWGSIASSVAGGQSLPPGVAAADLPLLLGGGGPPAERGRVGRGLGTDDVPEFDAAGPTLAPAFEGSAPDAAGEEGFFARLEFLGQARRCYLLSQSPNGLHIIDQHAAHERVVFERLKAHYLGGRVESQRLLFPLQLELEPEHAQAAEQGLEQLRRMGFELEHFGGRDWVISEVPVLLRNHEPGALVVEVLAQLADMGTSREAEHQVEHLLATMACHASVRAGDEMKPDEARALLAQMDGIPLRANCPHGRPVIVSYPFSEVARWFNRT